MALTLSAAAAPASPAGANSTGQQARAAANSQTVDALLAQADAKIRTGLLRLSRRFPQLQRTNSGTLLPELAQRSPAGSLGIYVVHQGNGRRVKGGGLTPVARKDAYSLVVFLRHGARFDDVSREQMAESELYPRLHLMGQVIAGAGDPKLDAALKTLLRQALASLQAREAQVNAL